MISSAIVNLFCQACGIKAAPVNLETVLGHLVNFCRIYKFEWQMIHVDMCYHVTIIPKSEVWIVEEAGATARESIMRAVAAVHHNMQTSSLSEVHDINSHKRRKKDESNKPTNR